MKALLPLIILATGLASASASAGTIVPIDPASHLEGLSTPIRDEPRTLQMVMSGQLLGAIPPGSTVTGLSFRLYEGALTSWPEQEAFWENYDIVLSSSLNGPGDLSPVFEENIGGDATLVRSGQLMMGIGWFSAGASPNEFGVKIGFTDVYQYLGGDLLITIRHSGNGTGSTAALEATSELGAYQLISADGYDAITGTENGMLVVQLEYSPVPEVSSSLLMAATVVLLGCRRGRRTRWTAN